MIIGSNDGESVVGYDATLAEDQKHFVQSQATRRVETQFSYLIDMQSVKVIISTTSVRVIIFQETCQSL